MKTYVLISKNLNNSLKAHLFKNQKEQGAFLFARDSTTNNQLNLIVDDIYLIPSQAWDEQESYYLELSNNEKVKIMKMARERDCNLIECHSHPHQEIARFSPSDVKGLEDFVGYVRWKLPGKKYGAIVCSQSSTFGLVWNKNGRSPVSIDEILVVQETAVNGPALRLKKMWERILFGFSRKNI